MTRRRASGSLVGLVVGASLASCRAPTEVRLEIRTDADCRDGVETAIVVGALDRIEQRPPSARTEKCEPATGRIGSLTIVPKEEDDGELALRVVTGFYKTPEECEESGYLGGCIVARRVLNFMPHESLQMPIFMESSCIDVPCGAVETCRHGKCVSARLDDPLSCTEPGGCNSNGFGGQTNQGMGGGSAPSQGGATGSGGALEEPRGGAPSDGGTDGGSAGEAPAPSLGGAESDGGTPSSGGATGSGGAGGASSIGGAPSGGAADGGALGFGGAAGGAVASFGGAANGGALTFGGTQSSGGTQTSGGAANGGAPGAGGSGPLACDLTGSHALKLSARLNWPATTSLASGSGTLSVWMRLDAVGSGNTLNTSIQECGRVTPNFEALLVPETYNFEFPDALFDSGELPRVSATATLSSTLPGASFTVPNTAFLLGASLNNPLTDLWPTNVLGLISVNSDSDAYPGITGRYKSGNGYSYPHAGATVLSVRADRAYIASRLIFSLAGTLTSCSTSSGSANVLAFDSHVLDCRLELGGLGCTIIQSQFLDLNRPIYTAGTASYEMVRVAPGSSCAVVRAAL